MRCIKSAAAAILAISLLAGSAVAAAAQDEEDAGLESAAFHVDLNFFIPEEVIVDEGSGLETLVDIPFKASDLRAAGLLTVVRAENRVTEDGLFSLYMKEGLRLVNDGGAWIGTNVRLMVNEKDQRTRKQKRKDTGKVPLNIDRRFMELTGEGGYEGLSMVVAFFGKYGEGVIMPTDAVPTQPEPPLADPAE